MSVADIPIAAAVRRFGTPCESSGTTLSPRTFVDQESAYKYSYSSEQPDFNTVVVLVVRSTAPELYQNWQEKSEFYRCFWQVYQHQPVSNSGVIPYSIWAANEREIGSPEDLAVSTVPQRLARPPLEQNQETLWRGVFSVTTPRKTLFSKPLEIRISELPRWKPRANLWGRVNNDEDE